MKIGEKLDAQDKIKIEKQQQVEKQLKFIGSSKLLPGHRCFEINVTTKNCIEADVRLQHIFGKEKPKQSVIIKENCVYINALNKANALKKFIKALEI